MVDCAATIEMGSPEYMAEFVSRALRDRVPVAGAFDLTYRCNLRCVHCYVGHCHEKSATQAAELGTSAVLRLLAEAAEAGCFDLLISGGEPLLRPDFTQIYTAACRLGLIISVFTNATLMDDRVLAAFREYPPYQVEISVYGATAGTYERVTGVPGSYAAARKGIAALLDAGVRVALKTMILRDNLHEIEAIEALADDLGVRFRLDPLVTPRLNGDPAPLEQRVDPAVAAALELATEKRLVAFSSFTEKQMAIADTPALYSCGAGLMGFHLDPYGVLRPCLMSQQYGFDAVGAGFSTAWRSVVETIEGLRKREDSECAGCKSRVMCGYCPGLFALETGSPHERSTYVCRLGERRSGIIDDRREVGRP